MSLALTRCTFDDAASLGHALFLTIDRISVIFGMDPPAPSPPEFPEIKDALVECDRVSIPVEIVVRVLLPK
jgi:hypothetical protein